MAGAVACAPVRRRTFGAGSSIDLEIRGRRRVDREKRRWAMGRLAGNARLPIGGDPR